MTPDTEGRTLYLDGKPTKLEDVPKDRLVDVEVDTPNGRIRPWRTCGDLSDAEFREDVVVL